MRRFLEMLVALVAALTVALVASPPAQAGGDVIWTQKKVLSCPSNHICLYPDGGFGQPSYKWEAADFPVGWCMRGIPQTTSYIDNNIGRRFYVYQTSDCSQPSYYGTIYPRSEGPMTGVWNNSIGSMFASSLTY